MSGKCLLDTNIVIGIFSGDEAVMTELAKAREIFIPSTVLGELYYGAQKSAHKKKNTAIIDQFASVNTILACDVETARQYGKIKESLHVKGRPIPENDIWIAAMAFQHEMPLVTRDQHFSEIKGLVINTW
jgi:tRNA(fMet)-specific endonuclease VapC